MAGTGRKVWVADEVLAATDLQNYIQDQVIFRYGSASARNAAILAPTEGMFCYLDDTNLLYFYDGSAWVEIAPNVGTAGTYTKVTTDAKGRVSSGTTLSAGDIPTIDINSQTSGTLAAARIASLDGSKITTGNIDMPGSVAGVGVNVKNGVGGYAVTMASNGNVAIGGTLNVTSTSGFGGNIYCTPTYNQANSGRAVYVAADGLFGTGGSSERFKENIVAAKFPVDAVRKILVREFDYKKEYGGEHQVGVIAEELIAIGLEAFVYYDDDGLPDGVAYEKLALAVLSLVQVESARLDELEARIMKLESK